ncbi:MAG: type II toxin-antitoxin system VapC family toxin [Candidatus Omnitrophica bacterium]|nr:type II toxin-antitoxin system VapC family toxin [Candidatus Omnitrophota bacterium]
MIYVDTNIFIYAIENHPKYGKACKNILLDIESEKIKASASVLVLVEIINVLTKINRILKQRKKKPLDIRKNIDAILSLPIIWFDLDFLIIKKASEYTYNVTGVDYMHIATMEINSITEIISADNEFDKIKFLKRIDPKEYRL